MTAPSIFLVAEVTLNYELYMKRYLALRSTAWSKYCKLPGALV